MVEDRDRATRVVDEPRSLQRAGCDGYALSSHTQHHGKELLGERELTGLHSIMRQQEPPATPLFERMKSIAGSRLRHQIEECVRVTK